MEIMDATGAIRGGGRPSVVAGRATELSISVDGIGDGAYTVMWHTRSADDGHEASGSFAFGVNASAAAAVPAPEPAASATPSSQAVRARWVYYLGLMGLLGVSFVAAVIFWPPPESLLRWGLLGCWLLALG